MYLSQSIADLFLRLALSMHSVSLFALIIFISIIVCALFNCWSQRINTQSKPTSQTLLRRCCNYC